MASFIESLHRASFRRVPFLVSSESVSRGKKVVLHEYPNSDQRYVEELGKLPSTFSLTAIVHGVDANNQRFRLEQVLEEPGIGLLVHPIYGELNVKALDFSVSSTQTEVGQFIFDIRFSQSRENITPEPDTKTNATISNLKADLLIKIDDFLERTYIIPVDPLTYNSFTESFTEVLNTVNQNINKAVDLSSKGASNFNSVYRSIVNNISSIVSSAQELRDNVTSFYTAALDAAILPEQLDSAWTNLIKYPLTVPLSSAITTGQQNRRQNDSLINEHLKLTALANSYESKVYKNYTTDDELYLARKILSDNYNNFLKRNNENLKEVDLSSIANDPDVRNNFANLRNNARAVFDEKEKAVFRVVTVNPGLTSMSLNNYRYYGNLDLIDEIIGLNNDVDVCNFNKPVKMLTE